MNLFLETQSLTKRKEDHLTCFLAAAIEVDPRFRAAYEESILAPLAQHDRPATIDAVATQVAYADEGCCPDLQLTLTDGRIVLCEHKLDAPETPGVSTDGEQEGQLQRYLKLPVDAVAYFRPSTAPPSAEVLDHPRYLRPARSPHFLWRDLFEPLCRGEHVLTSWLTDAFRRVGFTPPLPHVGSLWPETSEEVIQNQRNFGKLWDRTIDQVCTGWRVSRARRCALDFQPLRSGLVSRAAVSPMIQDGTILRFRAEAAVAQSAAVQSRLEEVARRLPVLTSVSSQPQLGGVSFVDVRTPLNELLRNAIHPEEQATSLFNHLVPLLAVLERDA